MQGHEKQQRRNDNQETQRADADFFVQREFVPEALRAQRAPDGLQPGPYRPTTPVVLKEEVKLVCELSAVDTIIDASAKVSLYGDTAASDDISRVSSVLSEITKKIGVDYEFLIICQTNNIHLF